MANTSLLERIGRSALDFMFPPRCTGCGAEGTFLCETCVASLERAVPPRCPCCWRPGVGATCIVCQVSPPPFDGLRAAYIYKGIARELVQSLKYRGMTALGAPIGSLCVDTLREEGLEFEVIVPVPLHGMRKRTRGFNQAELLARHIGSGLGVPVESRVLERRRRTAQQARSADAEERQRNVAGAFCGRRAAVEGRDVLLVDDVTTTGATLAACAQALKEAGAGRVWAFAFARED